MSESDPRHPHRNDSAGALVFWIIAQTCALLVLTRERSLLTGLSRADALAAMTAFDTALAAMLFPALVRSWRNLVEAVATMAMLLALTGLAIGATWTRVASAGGYVAVWTFALCCWSSLCRAARTGLIGTAVATSVTVGGAILAYLSGEFGTGASATEWSPIVAAWASAGLHFPPLPSLGVLVAVAIVGTVAARAGSWKIGELC